ncbi:hypothetical protein CANTEDRAFT_113509 [Yamadazyma tenuis ATCC 10573]|nr:uncharacterized protein CANTEDRAFT_113509 [Yamadazyma tenuis ATCC 10573]EGV65111.1 hypothetical protein CANTEDRAFT_113509 [Yamadazyma tenuis ATCC 10573]
MEFKDFETLLKKFHHYQAHADFGVEFIQNIISQAYCLKAFEEKNKDIFPIVDALLLENIPIKLLQSMILSSSVLGTERPLEIYNKYIQEVSAKPNEYTGRSPFGLLNESIILAFLYNNDRDFAHIIFDKVSMSGKLSESEVAIIKKVFKVYGDAFEEEDRWESAQPKLHSYIAGVIRDL